MVTERWLPTDVLSCRGYPTVRRDFQNAQIAMVVSCGDVAALLRLQCLPSQEEQMSDDLKDHPGDDAPLTASKHGDAAQDATQSLIEPKGDSLVGRAVTINRPRAELFAYWRDFANLPTFMDNVVSVSPIDDRRSHWVVKAPGGKTVEWDSAITEESENSFIAWASEPGADVDNSGRIDFRDAGARGTVVTATILYDPPAGAIGKLIAKMFQREPAIQARRDLARFKQLMETGEIATGAWTQEQLREEKD
jgi:uncharacterized membrane protein